jgi:hypothetical protein
MKNVALFVAGAIFLVVGAVQFARFKMALPILIGHEHSVPVDISLYMAIAAGVLGLWMFIAALCKK